MRKTSGGAFRATSKILGHDTSRPESEADAASEAAERATPGDASGAAGAAAAKTTSEGVTRAPSFEQRIVQARARREARLAGLLPENEKPDRRKLAGASAEDRRAKAFAPLAEPEMSARPVIRQRRGSTSFGFVVGAVAVLVAGAWLFWGEPTVDVPAGVDNGDKIVAAVPPEGSGAAPEESGSSSEKEGAPAQSPGSRIDEEAVPGGPEAKPWPSTGIHPESRLATLRAPSAPAQPTIPTSIGAREALTPPATSAASEGPGVLGDPQRLAAPSPRDAPFSVPMTAAVREENVVPRLRPRQTPVKETEVAVLPKGAAQPRVSLHAPNVLSEDEVLAESAAIESLGFELRDVSLFDFAITQTQIRYFHPKDAPAAEALADRFGAITRDFTNFRPSPLEGTIEVWIAGAGLRAPEGGGASDEADAAPVNNDI